MKYIVPFLVFLVFFGCKESEKLKNTIAEKKSAENTATIEQHPGKKLIETQCYVCHSPNATGNDRIAPPMIAVKKHYIDEDTTEDDFINAILAWTKEPTKEKSKMPGAIRRFGVMPYQAYLEKDIRDISEYMYSYDIEQPEWFEDHFQKENGKGKGNKNSVNKAKNRRQEANKTQKSTEEIGLEYAISTKQILGKNLMSTIQKKGTLAALKFCNVQAYPITDSMASVHNAKIKRVSDKPRNPSNTANTKELAYIESFKNDIANGSDINPIIDKNSSGEVEFYYPITTNSMCLQCHGTKNEVSPETLSVLKSLYPTDKALGYEVNEVRGIWSINFK